MQSFWIPESWGGLETAPTGKIIDIVDTFLQTRPVDLSANAEATDE